VEFVAETIFDRALFKRERARQTEMLDASNQRSPPISPDKFSVDLDKPVARVPTLDTDSDMNSVDWVREPCKAFDRNPKLTVFVDEHE
jgi:hypothetical protein